MSDIVGEAGPQDQTNNPDAVKSVEGARNFYRGTIEKQAAAVSEFVVQSGVFVDELRIAMWAGAINHNPVDQRFTDPGTSGSVIDGLFAKLHEVRANARMARFVLHTYGSVLPSSFSGHLYAIEGMANVMLADLYCSGIPLSLVNSDGSVTLRPGSSTSEVYRSAVALFDSAIALTGDSVRLRSFAQIGKGRALLALGEYNEAGLAVRDIPDLWVYKAEYRNRPELESETNGFARNMSDGSGRYLNSYTVSDVEGGNGIPFVTSGDPRTDTAMGVQQTPGSPYRVYVAKKYSDNEGNTAIIFGSAVEARLIEAEAALHKADTAGWLRILNALRTTCLPAQPCPTPAPMGLGGVSGLPLLPDPGLAVLPEGKSALDVRIDLLFAERAYWLFLTGHRQGDLRRLVRNYERAEHTAYPTGDYPFSTAYGQSYGVEVTLPVPGQERITNPLFRGCINREV